jgi:DNA-binding Lrp family transcriptional regulator
MGKMIASKIKLLGTDTDANIAKELGVHVYTINRYRKQLNIPAFRPIHKWTKAEESLIGTMPDSELAKQLDLSELQVINKRRKLKIAGYSNRPKPRAWTDGELKLLGTMSDIDLANLLQVSRTTVTKKRCKYNIPFFIKKLEFPEEVLSLFGKISDRELSRRFKINTAHSRTKRESLGIKPYSVQRGTKEWGERAKRFKAYRKQVYKNVFNKNHLTQEKKSLKLAQD